MTKTMETKLIWICDLKKPGSQGIKELVLPQGKRWRPQVVTIHSMWNREESLRWWLK